MLNKVEISLRTAGASRFGGDDANIEGSLVFAYSPKIYRYFRRYDIEF